MFKLRLIPAILLLLLLAGCKSDERILEKLGMVQTASYDLMDDKRLKVTYCVPVTDPTSKVRRELMTTVSDSLKSARLQFSRQTDLKVVSGQVRETLYGTKLAKEGLGDYIDTLLRDPSIALGVRVTLVEGDAGDLLSKTFKSHNDTGRYITHLLDKESYGNSVPATTLYEFSRDFNDDGIDPVAPIVKDGGDKVVIEGVAMFQEDRYVMRIPAKDGIIFALFRDDLRQGEAAINLGEKDGKPVVVMLSSILNKRKIKVHQLAGGRFKVDIYASIQGSVLEYTGEEKINESKARHELEQKISEYITAKADKMVAQMQEHDIDSLGIGSYVRNGLTYKEWISLNWKKVYPEIEVKCHTKVLIKDYGKYS
ncbi:Ger(x)C family spore germination protein [Paenibacillus tianjinensis]|uniref:Ger(X)C family spore germination protein n=1 Tax=Paenibacillus tianjinensis TaxID=2810347 RepID=A0ABX7LDZ9_9BACL|nr:Ger(x)C family spore germination protein [Paenibacillus tianjinensis]QSF44192.1 Ger(x)C family spore germination protein [Paenibacillus tianjinensis]